MSIQEVYNHLLMHLRHDEVIVIHEPTYNDFGELDTPQRTDEYGNPLLEIRRRANLNDAKRSGWHEYRPPAQPEGVKSAAPEPEKEATAEKTTSKTSTSKRKTTRTRKRRTKKKTDDK